MPASKFRVVVPPPFPGVATVFEVLTVERLQQRLQAKELNICPGATKQFLTWLEKAPAVTESYSTVGLFVEAIGPRDTAEPLERSLALEVFLKSYEVEPCKVCQPRGRHFPV